VNDLFARHSEGMQEKGALDQQGLEDINTGLKRMERFWADQIRYIY
jgi:hypothetical protein